MIAVNLDICNKSLVVSPLPIALDSHIQLADSEPWYICTDQHSVLYDFCTSILGSQATEARASAEANTKVREKLLRATAHGKHRFEVS